MKIAITLCETEDGQVEVEETWCPTPGETDQSLWRQRWRMRCWLCWVSLVIQHTGIDLVAGVATEGLSKYIGCLNSRSH